MSTWKSASHEQELEHVNKLMLDYEQANLALKDKLEIAKRTEENQIKHIQELEKLKTQQIKKIKSLEVSLKIEKATSEGIKKRSNAFEAEAHEYKEIEKLNKVKIKFYMNENEESLNTLQHERSTRLQLLHEKHNIAKEYAVLYQKYHELEEEHRSNNIMLIEKLQSLERLMQKKQQQDALLKLQSYEMIELNAEILQLKECSLQVQQKLLSREKISDRHLLQLDVMQQEISHLRKSLTVQATTGAGAGAGGMDQTNKSYAAYQHRTPDQYPITRLVNSITAHRYDTSRLATTKMLMTSGSMDSITMDDYGNGNGNGISGNGEEESSASYRVLRASTTSNTTNTTNHQNSKKLGKMKTVTSAPATLMDIAMDLHSTR